MRRAAPPTLLALAFAAVVFTGARSDTAGTTGPQGPIGAVRTRYAKGEHAVPMRDGIRLHTTVYAPRTCVDGGAPIMLTRTPYGVGPSGADAYRTYRLYDRATGA